MLGSNTTFCWIEQIQKGFPIEKIAVLVDNLLGAESFKDEDIAEILVWRNSIIEHYTKGSKQNYKKPYEQNNALKIMFIGVTDQILNGKEPVSKNFSKEICKNDEFFTEMVDGILINRLIESELIGKILYFSNEEI